MDATAEKKCGKGQKRKRSSNFSKEEILKLEQEVEKEENFKILTEKFSCTTTNKLKQEIWERIADEISQLGYAQRTATEVTNKWHNLKREAKEAVTEKKMDARKTGGGPSITESEHHLRIADLYSETSAFNGIPGGVDSDERDGVHFLANLPDEDASQTLTSTSQPAVEVPAPSVSTHSMSPLKISGSVKRKPIQKRRRLSMQEQLASAQLVYFEGEVRKQKLEMEKMEIQIRILKDIEKKQETMSAQELFSAISFFS